MKRIHVVRETGGLGDIIRIFAVLDALRAENPDAVIVYHGPEKYRSVIMDHCAAMANGAAYCPTDGLALRPGGTRTTPINRDAIGAAPEDAVIDLYCPAWQHERETLGNPTRERTRCWADAAGIKIKLHPPKYANVGVPLRSQVPWKPGDNTIALHPRSAALIRNWSPSRWRELAAELRGDGYIPVWFDDSPDYLRTLLDGLEGHCTVIGRPIGEVAAILSLMQAAITVDSGLFHLAGALGVTTIGLFGPTNGYLISSIYPTAVPVQAPSLHDCKGKCYGYRERGFVGGPCLDGCRNLAALEPDTVMKILRSVLS
jgi:ADP-heptose:LPS heptosyltransferase